jgi:hypothetical protein
MFIDQMWMDFDEAKKASLRARSEKGLNLSFTYAHGEEANLEITGRWSRLPPDRGG